MTVRRGIALCILGASALKVAGCGGMAGQGGPPFRLISTRNEIAMGNRVAPELERLIGGKVPSEHLQTYVQRVGQHVAAVAERRMPYQFFVVASDLPNAFALPCGRVYVTRGLLELLDNERQLAAVLANEVAHVAVRHPVKHLYRQMGVRLLVRMVRLGVEDPDEAGWQSALLIARNVLRTRHTRRDEIVADSLAIRYLTRAGYSPWGLVDLLGRLYRRDRNAPRSVAIYLRSHPLTRKRLKLAKLATEVDYYYFSPDSADPHASRFVAARKAGDRSLRKAAEGKGHLAWMLK